MEEVPRSATATTTITNGEVTSITLVDGGHGYTENPIVTIAAPQGSYPAHSTLRNIIGEIEKLQEQLVGPNTQLKADGTLSGYLTAYDNDPDGPTRIFEYSSGGCTHREPPFSIDELPAFVNFLDSGIYNRFPDNQIETGKRGLTHRIACILYVDSSEAPNFQVVHQYGKTYIEAFLSLLEANVTLNGTCRQCTPISYVFGEADYVNQQYWSIEFILEAETRTPTTFTA